MWMKKHARDRLIGAMSPVPTQIVSNEEFVPMRQSYDQRRVEYRIDQLAEVYAKKLGMSRRAFLKTSGGHCIYGQRRRSDGVRRLCRDLAQRPVYLRCPDPPR
jgi:hypothetical protein